MSSKNTWDPLRAKLLLVAVKATRTSASSTTRSSDRHDHCRTHLKAAPPAFVFGAAGRETARARPTIQLCGTFVPPRGSGDESEVTTRLLKRGRGTRPVSSGLAKHLAEVVGVSEDPVFEVLLHILILSPPSTLPIPLQSPHRVLISRQDSTPTHKTASWFI